MFIPYTYVYAYTMFYYSMAYIMYVYVWYRHHLKNTIPIIQYTLLYCFFTAYILFLEFFFLLGLLHYGLFDLLHAIKKYSPSQATSVELNSLSL